MKTNKEGVCPKCGSKILEYGVTFWDDERTIVVEIHCHNCGEEFSEVHKTTYLYTETKDE